MSTPPPGRSDAAPHQYRQMAESFGVDAARYDRTRPRYPDELVRRLLDRSPGPEILDVGCGTGIEARQFRDAGATVLGVEPDERMAELARSSGIDVEVATFEAWDARGRRFDAVIAGQAWHWVDPEAGALAAARVLRPGGLLAPFWNVAQLPEEIAQAFADGLRRAMPDVPFDVGAMDQPSAAQNSALYEKALDGIRAARMFGEPEEWRFDWRQTYGRDEWLDQMPTSGVLTRLPKDQLEIVLDGVGAMIDRLGGEITVGYVTLVMAAVRATVG